MNQTVNPILDFDESPEVSKVADSAMHASSYLIAVAECLPGIVLSLLHPQTNPAGLWIDAQHLNFNGVSGIHELTRMLYALGPTHLGNVHQTFDARFQFYERAVVGNAGDLTIQPRGRRKAFFNRLPGIGQQLFIAQ